MNFVFGIQYYRYPNPQRDDWQKDLENIKSHGMDYVKIWILWNRAEPKEGVFDFTLEKELCRLAADTGLKVIAQIILETAPHWAFRKYADSLYVDQTGRPEGPEQPPEFPDGWPGLCYDSRAARAAAERFMRKTAEEFKDLPNIFAWDVWNEPLNEAARAYLWHVGGPFAVWKKFCYCGHSMMKFREWLKTRYGSIQTLNKAWGTGYTDFNEIQPPRAPRVRYGPWISWRLFVSDSMAEKMRWRAMVFREIDPSRMVVSHSASTSTSYANPEFWEGCDDWKLARHVDMYGTSFYMAAADPAERMQIFDGIRSCCEGKPFWIEEMQNSPVGGFLLPPTSNRDIWLSWIMALASGTSGILYWQWRNERWGTEGPYFGCTKPDGSPGAGAERAKKLSALLTKIGDNLNACKVPTYTAVYHDPKIFHYCWVGVHSMWGFEFPQYRELPKECVSGAYKLAWDLDAQSRFVNGEVLQRKDLQGVSTLIMPFPVLIERKVADILKSFVNDGGNLIAEAPLAHAEDDGVVGVEIPGSGLANLFSVYVEPMVMEDSRIKVSRHEVSGFTKAKIEPINAEVVGRHVDGTPGITINDYGKGKGLFVGTTFTYRYFRDRSAETRNYLRKYIKSPLQVRSTDSTQTLARILYGDICDYVFLFNFSPHIEQVTVGFEKTYSHLKEVESDGGKATLNRVLAGKMKPNSYMIFELS